MEQDAGLLYSNNTAVNTRWIRWCYGATQINFKFNDYTEQAPLGILHAVKSCCSAIIDLVIIKKIGFDTYITITQIGEDPSKEFLNGFRFAWV